MRARRLLGFIIVALLAASCGSDRVAFDDLPVPPGAAPGGCSSPTLVAVAHRDLVEIRRLKARGAIGNCEETQWMLYHAISNNDTRFLALLLAAGVDVQAPLVSPDGCSPPLAYAFRHRHDGGAKDILVRDTSMLKLLIEAGADIEAEWHSASCYHSSWRGAGRPLVVAVVAGDVEFARLLIEAGADVDHRNGGGLTALEFVRLGVRPENREAMTALLREAMASQRR